MSDYMAQLLQNPPDSTAKVRLIERLEDSRDNACLERSTFHELFSDCIAALAERDARIAELERFRSVDAGVEVLLRHRIEALEAGLRGLVAEFDDRDEHRPLHAGCVQCTQGDTPDRYNTRPCAYHVARSLLPGGKG